MARTGVQWFVDEVQERDRAAWQALFVGYGEFYDVAMPPEKLDRVWTWLHDAATNCADLSPDRRLKLILSGSRTSERSLDRCTAPWAATSTTYSSLRVPAVPERSAAGRIAMSPSAPVRFACRLANRRGRVGEFPR